MRVHARPLEKISRRFLCAASIACALAVGAFPFHSDVAQAGNSDRKVVKVSSGKSSGVKRYRVRHSVLQPRYSSSYRVPSAKRGRVRLEAASSSRSLRSHDRRKVRRHVDNGYVSGTSREVAVTGSPYVNGRGFGSTGTKRYSVRTERSGVRLGGSHRGSSYISGISREEAVAREWRRGRYGIRGKRGYSHSGRAYHSFYRHNGPLVIRRNDNRMIDNSVTVNTRITGGMVVVRGASGGMIEVAGDSNRKKPNICKQGTYCTIDLGGPKIITFNEVGDIDLNDLQ